MGTRNGNEGVVKLLIEKGVNIESKNWIGQTPLSLAAGNGHENVVKILLEKGGVNLESKDTNDRTPLSLAVLRLHKEVVKLLIEKGAKPERKDRKRIELLLR